MFRTCEILFTTGRAYVIRFTSEPSSPEHDNRRPDEAHFADVKSSRTSSRRCPPVKCGQDDDSNQCPPGTNPVFSQSENGCPQCKCVPDISDNHDDASTARAAETRLLQSKSTTTATDVTCPPISCDELSCSGSILLRISEETGCPVCECTEKGNEKALDATTRPSPLEAVNKCPLINCDCVGQRHIDRDTGCETCDCENSAEKAVEIENKMDDSRQHETGSIHDDSCRRCDNECREAGTVRDNSIGCDVTACACVPEHGKLVSDDDMRGAPVQSSACPERPLDCSDFCGEDAVATSSLDEFGCDVCICSAVLSNSLTQNTEDLVRPLPPLSSPDSVECPEVDCGLLNCNERGGFVIDETTGCRNQIQQLRSVLDVVTRRFVVNFRRRCRGDVSVVTKANSHSHT